MDITSDEVYDQVAERQMRRAQSKLLKRSTQTKTLLQETGGGGFGSFLGGAGDDEGGFNNVISQLAWEQDIDLSGGKSPRVDTKSTIVEEDEDDPLFQIERALTDLEERNNALVAEKEKMESGMENAGVRQRSTKVGTPSGSHQGTPVGSHRGTPVGVDNPMFSKNEALGGILLKPEFLQAQPKPSVNDLSLGQMVQADSPLSLPPVEGDSGVVNPGSASTSSVGSGRDSSASSKDGKGKKRKKSKSSRPSSSGGSMTSLLTAWDEKNQIHPFPDA